MHIFFYDLKYFFKKLIVKRKRIKGLNNRPPTVTAQGNKTNNKPTLNLSFLTMATIENMTKARFPGFTK